MCSLIWPFGFFSSPCSWGASGWSCVHCELEIGDAVFFHCNLLHASAQNKSPHPRRAFLCCYNARRNSPYKVVRHPVYTPLARVPDSAIKDAGLKIANQEYSQRSHYNVVPQPKG